MIHHGQVIHRSFPHNPGRSFKPDLYDLARDAGCEPCNSHDLERVSRVGSVLHRDILQPTAHSSRLASTIQDLSVDEFRLGSTVDEITVDDLRSTAVNDLSADDLCVRCLKSFKLKATWADHRIGTYSCNRIFHSI